MEGIREFEEYNEEDRRVRERKIWRRNTKNKIEERKRDEVEFRSREAQKRRVAREIYGKVVI